MAQQFLLLLLFFSSSDGITYNCINKNTPSSSCCSGEITLDPTMTYIAEHAFSGCSGLTGSLTIPSSVTTIGLGAFYQCSGFTGSLTIPSSVTLINSVAFYNCNGFTGSLTLPFSLTFIGGGAFQYCSGFTSAVTFPNSVATLGSAAFSSNKCNWLSCCSNCTLTGAKMCLCDSPSCSGVCVASFSPSASPSFAPSSSPSFAPSSSPSFAPTASPSAAHPIVFAFGVKFGDDGIISSGKAILVDFLRDAKRGDTPLPSIAFLFSLSLPASSVSGKMFPISRIVNSSRVSSASDPPLSSNSILIKWRPVSVVSGIGSWEPNSHTILSIPAGGVLVSWLVSLLSEEIKGFIAKGE
jgi:hypothetical protein